MMSTDPTGRSIWTKLWKYARTGGDIGLTVAGVVQDYNDATNKNLNWAYRSAAAVSMVSEFLPFSGRDVGLNVVPKSVPRTSAAERLADKAQKLPASQRPNTVAVLTSADGKIVVGRNSGGVTSPQVDSALNKVGMNEFGGQCAEANCISRALNKGIDVKGAKIDVRNVRGPKSTSGVHGTKKPPCSTCKDLLDELEIDN